LNKEDYRQKIGDNAHKYARKNHDIKRIIEQDKKTILGLL
jgi:hypothetical protein